MTNEDTIIQFSESMITDSVFSQLVKIHSWPSVGMVFGIIIAVGYLLKFWPTFPNRAIPLVIIILGAGLMMLLADVTPVGIPARIWHTKNAVTGILIACLAWLIHNQAVRRLEDFLATKFNFVDQALGNKTQTRTEAKENPIAKPDPKI